jgi:hypothetical protein
MAERADRYDDLTRPATVPPPGTPAGIRVAYVSVTLPPQRRPPERAATPGRTLAGRTLGTPERSGRPALVAYCWCKIEDGRGLGFRISDIKLMFDGRRFFLNYPAEVREVKCGGCGGTNKPRATYCNWCGRATAATEPPSYHDLIFPLNGPSNELLLAALVPAYEDARTAADGDPRHTPRPSAAADVSKN